MSLDLDNLTQLRVVAVEQAIAAYSAGFYTEDLVESADAIYQFLQNGTTSASADDGV
ncbi:hypothetical protein SEA_CECE_178 [Microbacterium phage Cece]|nr:hypothetical protein SEA_CECE_178 [Microbacterium phage Cece]